MNSHQAKQIHLPQLLERLGYTPTSIKKDGQEYWYSSPFRSEKDASFHTSYLGGKWIWKDFGDIGGTVIDFIMRYEQLNTVKEALEYLGGMYSHSQTKKAIGEQNRRKIKKEGRSFSFQQQTPNQKNAKELTFLHAKNIEHLAIIKYLQKRKIPIALAKSYLCEVHYQNTKTSKKFFAFGMKNRSNGYEIRSASDDYVFKSALIQRDITLIKGRAKNKEVINIFEGMLDFLSLLEMFQTNNLNGDSLIMHSLSSFQAAIQAIKNHQYKKVNLFLDNNKAGQEHAQKFIEHFGNSCESQSYRFAPHEDLNDALVHGKKIMK